MTNTASVSVTWDGGWQVPPAVIERAQDAAQKAIDEAIREAEGRDLIERALKCDKSLKDLLDFKLRYPYESVPVVRAHVYKPKEIFEDQEILHPFDYGRGDPRRPVVMRSAKHLLIAQWADHSPHCANGFVRELVCRFLRKKKFTCLTLEEWDDHPLLNAVNKKISSQAWCLRGHSSSMPDHPRDGSRPYAQWGYCMWINGKYVQGLGRDQAEYIQKMYSIIRKTNKTEDRMKLLRKWRKTKSAEPL